MLKAIEYRIVCENQDGHVIWHDAWDQELLDSFVKEKLKAGGRHTPLTASNHVGAVNYDTFSIIYYPNHWVKRYTNFRKDVDG